MATVIVVLILIPLVLLLLRVIHPRLKRLGKGAHEMASESISILQQSLQGIREVVLFHKEDYFVNRYRRARWRLARS